MQSVPSALLSSLDQLPGRKIPVFAAPERAAGDAFSAFALAAHLADLAIEAALELGQMPGVDMKALQPTIQFWKVVRDHSQAAALACVGANYSLAGALVAFRLLRNIGGEETENHAK